MRLQVKFTAIFTRIILSSFELRVYQLRKRASLTLELYRQAQANASLIGTLEPPVTPTCLNSNGVNHIVHGLFVLSAIGFKRNDHHCL
ncbi:hypothetical protein Y032_0251g175 [Ancylostoma ceylanicum]|uniref:Uncharacterized protein n=1 Tax=Ancylostoma ceylanicum TaxID=53326 RepID=A0A016SCS5_9BILA|nr:hypothetical protein Y032_0251g175 [Ancylostoma ceylanicum]